jgi:hypothetical protein
MAILRFVPLLVLVACSGTRRPSEQTVGALASVEASCANGSKEACVKVIEATRGEERWKYIERACRLGLFDRCGPASVHHSLQRDKDIGQWPRAMDLALIGCQGQDPASCLDVLSLCFELRMLGSTRNRECKADPTTCNRPLPTLDCSTGVLEAASLGTGDFETVCEAHVGHITRACEAARESPSSANARTCTAAYRDTMQKVHAYQLPKPPHWEAGDPLPTVPSDERTGCERMVRRVACLSLPPEAAPSECASIPSD